MEYYKDTPLGCNNRSPLRKRWVREIPVILVLPELGC